MRRKKTEGSNLAVVITAVLMLAYQTAIFVHRAAKAESDKNKSHPDTVYIYAAPPDNCADISENITPAKGPGTAAKPVSNPAAKPPSNPPIPLKKKPHQAESFPFDPNTVSVGDLQRLGFTEAQAQSIENYRAKGGVFRRKEDFAKSFVVSEETYSRLESFIDIPPLDINRADSSDFDRLPGIGPYYAARMVSYRKALGGYSNAGQLMDIRGIDSLRYSSFRDLIVCSAPHPFGLWQLPADSLERHPYIGDIETARSIERFRQYHDSSDFSVDNLLKEGILTPEKAEKLKLCRLE